MDFLETNGATTGLDPELRQGHSYNFKYIFYDSNWNVVYGSASKTDFHCYIYSSRVGVIHTIKINELLFIWTTKLTTLHAKWPQNIHF